MGAAATMAYTGGGKVEGPGTGTSDSVPVRLSKGEFVIPADSVKKIGVHALHAMVAATHKHVKPAGNKRVRKMANGGVVGDDSADPNKQPDQLPTYPSMGATQVAMNDMAAAAPVARAPAPVAPIVPGASSSNLPSGQMALAARGAQQAVDDSMASGDYGAAVGHAVRGGLGIVGGAVADVGNAVAPATSAITRAARVLFTGDDSPSGTAVAQMATPTAGVTQPQDVNRQAMQGGGTASPPAPMLNGGTGVTVEGAPGVSKFVVGGRTLYSNTPDGNDSLLSKSVTPTAQNDAAAQNLSDNYGAVARLAAAAPQAPAGPQAFIPGVTMPASQWQTETDARNAGVNSTITRGASRQDVQAAQMANQKAIAAMTAQAGLQGHQISANASRYATEVGAGTAANQLALQTAEAGPKIQLAGQQVATGQRMQDIQRAYAAATDPVQRRQLYEQLIAMQGHVRSLSERFTPVSQGSNIDPATGLVTQQPHLLFDNQTGQWVPPPQGSGAASRLGAAPAQPVPATKDKLVSGTVYQTARGPAKWNGQQFVAQ